MSGIRKIKPYAVNSLFIRAALDFAVSFKHFQGFGAYFDDLPASIRAKALREAAVNMFAGGHVTKAVLHLHNQSGYIGDGHNFKISFARTPSGLSPCVSVPIKTEAELKEKADFYKSQSRATLGAGIRKPKPTPSGGRNGRTL